MVLTMMSIGFRMATLPWYRTADDLLDLRLQRLIMPEVVLRGLEAVETGGTGDHDIRGLLLRARSDPAPAGQWRA